MIDLVFVLVMGAWLVLTFGPSWLAARERLAKRWDGWKSKENR